MITAFATDLARSAVWLVLLTVVFVPAERLFAERSQPVRRRQLAADLGYYAVNSLGTVSVLSLLSALIATLAQRALPAGWLGLMDGLGLWSRVALTLLVSEFGSYWGHRWSHQVPFLWRFHAIHHSAEEVDWLTAARGHPVDLVFTRLCGLTLVCAIGLARVDSGVPNAGLLGATVFSMFWGYFIHANLRCRFGWLERVIATPGFHRWHHAKADVRDRNYASTLPIYDLLFGTYHLPARGAAPSYGIDAEMPASFWAQLAAPLKTPRSGAAVTLRPGSKGSVSLVLDGGGTSA